MTPDYVLLGNITADVSPGARVLGGTVSYSAPTARAFGLTVGVVTAAAVGEPLLAEFPDHIVIVPKPSAVTTTFENIYTPSGRIQYIRAAAPPIEPSDIPAEWLQAERVHLGPIAGETDPRLASCFPRARVMLTLQGCIREWGADGRVRFKRWFDADSLEHVDVVVFSEEDIAGAPDMEGQFAAAVRHLVVTRAERGGTLYIDGVPQEYPTPQVEMVHPTGAGDIFAAALLSSLELCAGDYAAACRVAAYIAAQSVTRVGPASTPTREEVQRALQLNGILPTKP